MSIISLFTRQAPTIAGYQFDAVLEDTLDVSVEWTMYPVESGVNVNDHRIIQPVRWTMTGAVSNNPLKVQLTDFLAGGLSNLTNNPYVAAVAGLAAGFLAGSDQTRASTTLEFLITLMRSGEPFAIDAGDIQLQNMVISRIGRTKDISNESGLIFVCEMQELITLDRLQTLGQPSQMQLRDGDPTKSALSSVVKKGQQIAKDVNDTVSTSVNNVLDGIF
ncbi:structural protein [Pantoea phage vB_PagM_AAM22]|nr:structural protein [Pantoea phage vB_PagM_AAM22]